jgi:hypothetical protein
LMAVSGAILLMMRYKALNVAFAENWEEQYQIAGQERPADEPEEEDEVEEVEEEETPRVRRVAPKRASPRRKAQ